MSIESVNIDLNADEDMGKTPKKGVEVIDFVVTFKILTISDQLFSMIPLILVKGTPCQLSIKSIYNIILVATVFDDNIECPSVKVF